MNLPDQNDKKYRVFKASPGAQRLIDDLYKYTEDHQRLRNTNYTLLRKLDALELKLKNNEKLHNTESGKNSISGIKTRTRKSGSQGVEL